MKITIVGMGYVGLSLAVLLSQKYEITILEIDKNKVDLLNKKISPILDNDIIHFLEYKNLNIKATLNKSEAYKNAEYVVICTPTDYDLKKQQLNTSSIKKILIDINKVNVSSNIIIKSTVPIGFTDEMCELFDTDKIMFSPEFSRESKSLYDNLYPSRIVMSRENKDAQKFVSILKECALKEKIDILYTSNKEAEAIKLFSNAYLAMRIAFFNELDMLAEKQGMNSKNIIDGMAFDPRIGNSYNNPSFGYGGYCLPKDTEELTRNFRDLGDGIINSITTSNDTRIDYIVKRVINMNLSTVGVYRINMKKDSVNFRSSVLLKIIEKLQKNKINVLVYEPLLKEAVEFKLVNNLKLFKTSSDLIIANRMNNDLLDVLNKVYTRDIYNVN